MIVYPLLEGQLSSITYGSDLWFVVCRGDQDVIQRMLEGHETSKDFVYYRGLSVGVVHPMLHGLDKQREFFRYLIERSRDWNAHGGIKYTLDFNAWVDSSYRGHTVTYA